MSIWGKIVGGAAGFAVGGPLGAILGAVAGHAVDKMAEDSKPPGDDGGTGASNDPTRRIAFTIAVIVLGAKMAKADGHVTKDEIAAFRQVFHIPPEEVKNVGRLFDQARRDANGFEPYAKQIARLFRDRPAVLEELLDGLFHIARADGHVTPEELDYLQAVANIFGLDEAAWHRLKAANLGPDAEDPYHILGVTRETVPEAIKAAYRKLIRENHPDRLVAEGMPQEFVAMANEKMAKINVAYDRICKEKGIS
ncbi:TerB family tellurite resistance protein [Limibacillus sp. MBR-115]|jgi:DnaJ like chaperone protein|uniref:TerB family tellurite resistance protein n=1 Tax=Limibacillus sp. MBR-115 TaxID=3156465 RepID=UPI00339702D6